MRWCNHILCGSNYGIKYQSSPWEPFFLYFLRLQKRPPDAFRRKTKTPTVFCKCVVPYLMVGSGWQE